MDSAHVGAKARVECQPGTHPGGRGLEDLHTQGVSERDTIPQESRQTGVDFDRMACVRPLLVSHEPLWPRDHGIERPDPGCTTATPLRSVAPDCM